MFWETCCLQGRRVNQMLFLEDGGSRFLQNFSNNLPDYTAYISEDTTPYIGFVFNHNHNVPS
jgi:hypothetical protein